MLTRLLNKLREGWRTLTGQAQDTVPALLEGAVMRLTAPTRPAWGEYFMDIARLVSTRATCPRRHVGAVLVRDKRILCTGYTGAPSGVAHCEDVGCVLESKGDGDVRCIRTLHAEMNVITQAARYGISTEGATLYTTCRPCHICARLIAGAGIAQVVYVGDAPEGWTRDLFASAGIAVELLNDEVKE